MKTKKQQFKPRLNPSHYWKIDKFYWTKRMDTDRDGVKDHHDCQPLNPHKQDPDSVQQDVIQTQTVRQQQLQQLQQKQQAYMKTRMETAKRNLPKAQERVKQLEQRSKELEQKMKPSVPQPQTQRQQLIQQLQEQARKNPAMRQQYESAVQRIQASQPGQTPVPQQVRPGNVPQLTKLGKPSQPAQQPQLDAKWEAARVRAEQAKQQPQKYQSSYTYYKPTNVIGGMFASLLKRKWG